MQPSGMIIAIYMSGQNSTGAAALGEAGLLTYPFPLEFQYGVALQAYLAFPGVHQINQRQSDAGTDDYDGYQLWHRHPFLVLQWIRGDNKHSLPASGRRGLWNYNDPRTTLVRNRGVLSGVWGDVDVFCEQ
jgi:hypothetical protein